MAESWKTPGLYFTGGKMIERCDFYSDEEYEQALTYQEEEHKEQEQLEEYEKESAQEAE